MRGLFLFVLGLLIFIISLEAGFYLYLENVGTRISTKNTFNLTEPGISTFTDILSVFNLSKEPSFDDGFISVSLVGTVFQIQEMGSLVGITNLCIGTIIGSPCTLISIPTKSISGKTKVKERIRLSLIYHFSDDKNIIAQIEKLE